MKKYLVFAAVLMLPIITLQGMVSDPVDEHGCYVVQYSPVDRASRDTFDQNGVTRAASIDSIASSDHSPRRDAVDVFPTETPSVFDIKSVAKDDAYFDFEALYNAACAQWGGVYVPFFTTGLSDAPYQSKRATTLTAVVNDHDEMQLQANAGQEAEFVISPVGSSHAVRNAVPKKRSAEQAFLQLYESRIGSRLIRMPNHGKLPDAFNAFSHVYCFYRGIKPGSIIDAVGNVDRGIKKIVNRCHDQVYEVLKDDTDARAAIKHTPLIPVSHCLRQLLQEQHARGLLWDCWYEEVAASMIVTGTVVAEQGLEQITDEVLGHGFYNAFCVGLPVAFMVKMGAGDEAHWMTVGFMLDAANKGVPSKCYVDIFSTKHGQDKNLGDNGVIAWPQLQEHENELQVFSHKIAATLLTLADQPKQKRR